MSVLLISTYDMGRQPFGLASPAAWLREAGVEVMCTDLARERFQTDRVKAASVIGFFLPMHTATRLALPVIDRVRRVNPGARLVAYGLYAPLNAKLLRERGVDHVLGGEFEEELVRFATPGGAGRAAAAGGVGGAREAVPRLSFRVPFRGGLPPLSAYATVQVGGERRTVGYTEASRGCKHRCRHCPIVPVYDGRFRIVQADVVIADVRAQADAGARHITFGDPDFFNGIGHARTVLQRFERECPGLTYDVTIKIEHLLKHADLLPLLRDSGCAFVTSAVESLDDEVLRRLEKGHTRRDVERAVSLCRDARVPLCPTFVPFTPWTTVDGYLELLHEIERLGLTDHVAPIQYAIRLLLPRGSRMLELPEVRELAGPFDAVSLTHPWRHRDPRVDALHEVIMRTAGVQVTVQRHEAFERVWTAAHDFAGSLPPARTQPVVPRATIPYLNEPWYC